MGTPNVFHGDKWKVNFSNIPTVERAIDLKLYDWYVKSIVIPTYSVELLASFYKGGAINHPVSKANDNLDSLNIEFKADEDLDNYYNLFEYMQELRYGQNYDTADYLRKNVIKKIEVELLDNQKRKKGALWFTNAFLVSLSSLNLTNGQDEEISFSCSFKYEEIGKS